MKQQTKGGALHKVWQALPWLWMAAAYLFDLWYQLVPGKWIVDSDLASEMILSDLLNKEGTIISHNWFYSTELKVVNLQWFYRLGLLIFPNDWHLARTFGMAITLALFAAAMLFFVKCAGLGRAGLWMVGTLLWPFGQHYLVYAIYGGYYLVYTFFYMLVLALVLRSLNADKKHCALQWVLACVITAVAGMNGVKQLMVFHAPLCLAAAILLVLALHSCGKTDWKAALDVCRKEVRLLAASLVTAVAAAAGYFVSNAVLSRMYDFKSYNFIVWNRDEDWFTLDRILMDFFHEFGYENGSGVFHFGGIAAAVGLLLGCWMFFCIVRLLLRLDKLERNDKLLVLLLVAMLAVCGVAYTYFHEYYLYFWLMNMPVAIAVMAVEIKTEDFHILGAPAAAGRGAGSLLYALRRQHGTPGAGTPLPSPQGAEHRRRMVGGQRLYPGLFHILERQRHDRVDQRQAGSLDAAIAGPRRCAQLAAAQEPPDHRPGAPLPAHRHRDGRPGRERQANPVR